jgi:hypothetical protein
MGDEVPLRSVEGGVQVDVTEKYILMNRKAEEVQKLLHQGVRLYGTPFWYNNILIRVLAGEVFYFADFNEIKKETIWLPTQDQLQRLTDLSGKALHLLTSISSPKYRLEVDLQDSGIILLIVDGDSLEQIWLKFIMKDKYNKEWDEKNRDWTKGEWK